MLKIVRYISLALLLVSSCDVEPSQQGSRHVAIVDLHSLARDRSQPITSDVYVEGYVVAVDQLFRELEYAIVIDDGSAGVELKIDCRDIGAKIPMFSYVRLNCSGLSIGREGRHVVLGAYPEGEYVVDRLPESEMFNYLQGPNLDMGAPCPYRLTISELSTVSLLSYVHVNHLRVVDEDQGKAWCEPLTDAPNSYRTTLRHFTDGVDTLAIITAAGCSYAQESVPDGEFSTAGILEWRDGDYALRISGHQIAPVY